jgi:hypothetical protein
MPNPNRPNDGEVIPAIWGQLTADRVVRRYRSREERDVDTAGLPDRAGQLIVVQPTGQAPWLEFHDGNDWRRIAAGPLIGGDLSPVIPEINMPNGVSISMQERWLVGGMELVTGYGTARGLRVPYPGIYRVCGYIGFFGNHNGYCSVRVSRVSRNMGGDAVNDPARRALALEGSNPDRSWPWRSSVFAGVVPCNEGDGIMPHLDCDPGLPMNSERGSFAAYFIGDLPPGVVVPPPPALGDDPVHLPEREPEPETLPS